MTHPTVVALARLTGRLWEKVDRDGSLPAHCPELGNCWVWTGAITKFGYGKFSVAKNMWELAHIVSWVLANGPVPDGLFVMHRCDNPPCIRPSHLMTGTAKDNAQDMISKGRWGYPSAKGVRNRGAKLTNEQVIAIRERFAAGEPRKALSAKYGISPGTASKIINGRSWRHVAGPIRPLGRIDRRQRSKSHNDGNAGAAGV